VIQNTDERRVRRGYAILGGLLLAAVLVFNLDAILDRARGSIDVVALVSETSGVRVGSPVWIAGTRAGHVTGIGFAGDGDSALIAIDVRLEDRFRPLLGESATAYTTKRRLIGQPMVRIETGTDRSRPLEDGDTVAAATRVDLDALLARGEAFPAALDSLQSALREVQARVQARRPQLVALTDRIASTTEAAASLGAELERGSLGPLLTDPRLGQRIEALESRLVELDHAGRSLGRYTDGELARRVPTLLERAGRLEGDLDRLRTALESSRGTLPRLGRDSALALAIRGVEAQIDSLRAEGLELGLRMLLP
jgi:hypothetical protein